MESFLQHLNIDRGASPYTQRNYRQALRDFRKAVPERAWRELKADDFRRYLFERMKAGLAKPTIRRRRNNLLPLDVQARDLGRRFRNPGPAAPG